MDARRCFIVLLLCMCIAIPVNALRIVEICPDTYLKGEADEFFVIEGDGPLGGVMVTDGEGSVRFPAGAGISGRLVIARQGVGFERVHGYSPDYEMYDSSSDIPDMVRAGTVRLGNRADELTLSLNGKDLQEVAWPGDLKCREGQVHMLEDGVWDRRPFFIGQSRFEPATFQNVSVTAFVSPDCSLEVMDAALTGADEYLLVNVYEFTHGGVADTLSSVSRSGVNVTVLLEGGPVGGVPDEEYCVVNRIVSDGARVMQITTTDDAHARYRFDHAKYIVVDGEAILIASENIKPSGFPAAGQKGNRGWGAYCENSELAAYFEKLFAEDADGGDIIPFPDKEGYTLSDDTYGDFTVTYAPSRFTGAVVTPVISPDTSYLVTGLIDGAVKSVDIEQAYIKNWTGGRDNPFLSAAVNASRRGAVVRVLLDSYYYNVDGDNDNDEMAEYINRVAESEGLPLEARLVDLKSSNLQKIHNKGVIVDGTKVLISSINWNENSPSFNRETGIIVEHPGVGDYYESVFESDWYAAREAVAEESDAKKQSNTLKMAIAGVVAFALFLLYVVRKLR